jgi:ribose 5-phosphate isomerase A
VTAQLESYKQQAAEQAILEIQSGMRLGLGTGSTARYIVIGLGERLRDGRLRDIVGIPTSEATAALARSVGVPLITLDDTPEVDLTIDGADEIDPDLNLIKGLGGALLREKIVAATSRRLVIVADTTKLVTSLGEHGPLPVEIIPFGKVLCERRIQALGAQPRLRLASNGTPFRTDQGNYILDCHFPSIREPHTLSTALHAIPGIVEHGLFIGMATAAFVAGMDGVTVLRAESSTES